MGGDTAYGGGGRHLGGSRTRSSSNSSTETDWYPTMHGDASETLFQRPGRRFSVSRCSRHTLLIVFDTYTITDASVKICVSIKMPDTGES